MLLRGGGETSERGKREVQSSFTANKAEKKYPYFLFSTTTTYQFLNRKTKDVSLHSK
jgi:hypothetical protein